MSLKGKSLPFPAVLLAERAEYGLVGALVPFNSCIKYTCLSHSVGCGPARTVLHWWAVPPRSPLRIPVSGNWWVGRQWGNPRWLAMGWRQLWMTFARCCYVRLTSRWRQRFLMVTWWRNSLTAGCWCHGWITYRWGLHVWLVTPVGGGGVAQLARMMPGGRAWHGWYWSLKDLSIEISYFPPHSQSGAAVCPVFLLQLSTLVTMEERTVRWKSKVVECLWWCHPGRAGGVVADVSVLLMVPVETVMAAKSCTRGFRDQGSYHVRGVVGILNHSRLQRWDRWRNLLYLRSIRLVRLVLEVFLHWWVSLGLGLHDRPETLLGCNWGPTSLTK